MTISACIRGLDCDRFDGVPFSRLTTFKIGGEADALLVARNAQALCALLSRLREAGIPFLLLGAGSNLLVSDRGFRGAAVMSDSKAAAIEQIDALTLRADAGVPLPKLSRFAQQAGLTGLEFACGIPGSVGGGVYMNAGAYGGELAQVVRDATVLHPNGETEVLPVEALSLSYRHSALMDSGDIVLSVTVRLTEGDSAASAQKMSELLTARREKQPLEYPSAGSFFKRPTGYFAGKLIDDCGLRGLRVGDAQISKKHAGFVVNRGSATCEEVRRLEQTVRTRVQEECGVTLQPEVRLIGDEWLP